MASKFPGSFTTGHFVRCVVRSSRRRLCFLPSGKGLLISSLHLSRMHIVRRAPFTKGGLRYVVRSTRHHL